MRGVSRVWRGVFCAFFSSPFSLADEIFSSVSRTNAYSPRMQCCMNTNRPQPIALDTFCALITNINFYQPALANEIEKRLRNGFAQFLITQLYEVRIQRSSFSGFLLQQHVFEPNFGWSSQLWTRFASPQNDLWRPNFSQIEFATFLVERNFPFPDSATRKVSRTNSAKNRTLTMESLSRARFYIKFSLF